MLAAACVLVYGRAESGDTGSPDLHVGRPSEDRGVARTRAAAAPIENQDISTKWAFSRGRRPTLPAAKTAPDEVAASFVHALLREQIARKLPHLSLSDDELGQMSEAMVRIRATSARLRELEHTSDNAAALRRAREQLTADLGVLADVSGMGASELTDALSDEGLTTEDKPQEEIIYEPLSRYSPR